MQSSVLLCLPLALLFLASAVPSNAQSVDVVVYDLLRNQSDPNNRFNFTLDCSAITTNVSANIVWTINGTELEKHPAKEHYQLLPGAGGQQRAVLTLRDKPREDDFGNYTCALRDGQEKRFEVKAKPIARLPANTNVVEGQKLKLQCKLLGRPYVPVTWWFSSTSELMENASLVTELFGPRATVSDFGAEPTRVEGGELAVDPAQGSDAGWYQCRVDGGYDAVTRLRVKDMYAALWPFLGICAEVFVLCAIILVYERRRTKPELDDSDTDNHDQKKS